MSTSSTRIGPIFLFLIFVTMSFEDFKFGSADMLLIDIPLTKVDIFDSGFSLLARTFFQALLATSKLVSSTHQNNLCGLS